MIAWIMDGTYEAVLVWSGEREQFGRPINEFQGLQWNLADMSISTAASQALVYKAAASGADGFSDKLMAARTK